MNARKAEISSGRAPAPASWAARVASSVRAPLSLLALLAVLCLGLSACGSSKPKQSSLESSTKSPEGTKTSKESQLAREQTQALAESTHQLATPTKLSPSTVLARVSGVPITFATVQHQMVLKSPQTPLPDPPAYSDCIARVKGTQSGLGRSEAQLKEACQQSYEHLFQSALSASIHNQWLIGEAGEEGVRVSPREVQEEFEQSKKQFRSEAEFATYRKGSGQTISDMLFEIKVGKLANGIFNNIKSKERPVTEATVAAYYRSHQSRYTIPEGRALRILRTTSEAAALRARQQLKAGKGFASIVAELPGIGQPITARHGEVKDLLPGVYGEKVLNDAIFSAQPGRLYGPVRVASVRRTIAPEADSGFFLFEVLRKIPAHLTALSQVKAAIREELVKAEKERTVSGAIAQIKAKWKARTDCQSGFVVKNCSQYTGSKRAEVGDPFTL
jgi:hypothetical protein